MVRYKSRAKNKISFKKVSQNFLRAIAQVYFEKMCWFYSLKVNKKWAVEINVFCCFFNINNYILFRAIPDCLGRLGHFKNKFSDPIGQGQRHSATKRALATARKAVRDVVKKISPFFLRRTKALIKEQLPKKNDRVRCDITKVVRVYDCNVFSLLWKLQYYFLQLVIILRKSFMMCFILGSVLFSDGLSADCVSGGAGHWGCDVTAEIFREVWLSKWAHPQKLLLRC